eukprot:gnl/TRDRNA2_/TRDRNA2_90478_c0_seq1.p1 gnl/TRDRNA2_/TRDRNA2_90478_c0~~gnl/TRDRNA2_/TRDRNA2_90478_c0_seq1.p1  ORF type:complete len:621 (-),score=104.85 gnl/TRDRNA2_/TRDRNA2_90478_c0_seq1:45-1907(-)
MPSPRPGEAGTPGINGRPASASEAPAPTPTSRSRGGAAWEAKWRAMEADITEAVEAEIASMPARLPPAPEEEELVLGSSPRLHLPPVPVADLPRAQGGTQDTERSLQDFFGSNDVVGQLQERSARRVWRGTPRNGEAKLPAGPQKPAASAKEGQSTPSTTEATPRQAAQMTSGTQAPAPQEDELADHMRRLQAIDAAVAATLHTEPSSSSAAPAEAEPLPIPAPDVVAAVAPEQPAPIADPYDSAVDPGPATETALPALPATDAALPVQSPTKEAALPPLPLDVDDVLRDPAADAGDSGARGLDLARKVADASSFEPDPVAVAGDPKAVIVPSAGDPKAVIMPSAAFLRSAWRLWFALVGLSVVEVFLVMAVLVTDQTSSPCREPLAQCVNLHQNDCTGASCQVSAPVWAPVWPAGGLLFLALPMRWALAPGGGKGYPGLLLVALCLSLMVVGFGTTALLDILMAGLRHGARCPMPRADSRCSRELCPMPPCRRMSEFAPCECGTISEAEMARALWLNNQPACQPFEWYTWQMQGLDDLLTKYETFACAEGPLCFASLAAGGVLLLVQLSCCPVLLLGRWGVHQALVVLFASEKDREVTIEVPAAASAARPGADGASSSV